MSVAFSSARHGTKRMPHENSVTVERYGIVTGARTSRPVVSALSLALDWLQARTGNEVFVLRWPLWARALSLAEVRVLVPGSRPGRRRLCIKASETVAAPARSTPAGSARPAAPV